MKNLSKNTKSSLTTYGMVVAAYIICELFLQTAEKLGVPTRAEEITVTEAMNADELIITSSGTLCNRITEVDKIPVGGKADELFHKLQDAAWDEFMVYTKQK